MRISGMQWRAQETLLKNELSKCMKNLHGGANQENSVRASELVAIKLKTRHLRPRAVLLRKGACSQ